MSSIFTPRSVPGGLLLLSLSLLLLSLPLPGKDEAAVPFVHPGLLHSQAEIDFVRTRIRAGKEPWKTAWKHLKSHDLTSLERKSRKGDFLLFQIRSGKGSWKLVAEYLD